MKPELRIRNGLGCFDHPGAEFVAIDHHCAASKLLARGDPPAGAVLIDLSITDPINAFMATGLGDLGVHFPSTLPRNGATSGDGFSNDLDTLKSGAPMIWQLISAGSSALRITREP